MTSRLSPILDAQMDVIGGNPISQHKQATPFPGLKKPIDPGLMVTCKIQQKLAILHFRAKGLANAQRVPLATRTPPTLAFSGFWAFP